MVPFQPVEHLKQGQVRFREGFKEEAFRAGTGLHGGARNRMGPGVMPWMEFPDKGKMGIQYQGNSVTDIHIQSPIGHVPGTPGTVPFSFSIASGAKQHSRPETHTRRV